MKRDFFNDVTSSIVPVFAVAFTVYMVVGDGHHKEWMWVALVLMHFVALLYIVSNRRDFKQVAQLYRVISNPDSSVYALFLLCFGISLYIVAAFAVWPIVLVYRGRTETERLQTAKAAGAL